MAISPEQIKLLSERGLLTPETLALAESQVSPAPAGSFENPDSLIPVSDNIVPEPAPVIAEPAPVFAEPAPVFAEPAPVIAEPAPAGAPVSLVPDDYQRYGQEISALEQQKEMVPQITALEQQKAGFESEGAEQRAQLSAEREQDLSRILLERDESVNNAVREMREEFDTYKKMDIKDFWADRSQASRIMTVIGIGLGGWSGGTNSAFQIVKDAMDRDYKSQKAAIDKQFTTYKIADKNVEDVKDLYQDRIKSLDLMHLARLQKVKDSVTERVMSLGNENAKLRGSQLISKLDVEIAKAQDKSFREVQDAINRRLLASQKRTSSGFTPYQQWRVGRDVEEREVPGYGPARTKIEAKSFRDQVATTNDVTQAIDRMLSLGTNISLMDRGELGRLQAEQKALIGKLRVPLTGGGVLSQSDMDMIMAVIGDPAKFFSTEGIQSGRLNTLKNIIVKGTENLARQVIIGYGGKPSGGKTQLEELSPEDRQGYEWAKENLSNPRAVEILEYLQKKYPGS